MPDEKQSPEFFTPYARRLVRFKARSLSNCRGFRHFEVSDLQQELWLALQQQVPNFDPDRASIDTFINRVVESASCSLIRDQQRARRHDDQCTRSLDAPPAADDSAETLSGSLSDSDRVRHTGRVASDARSESEDREAVDQALRSMPAVAGDVCRRLMNGSVSSVARDLGTSRRQIRNAIAEAREHLQEAGF